MKRRSATHMLMISLLCLPGCAVESVDSRQINSDFNQLSTALEFYKRDYGSFPSTRQGLSALEPDPDSQTAIGRRGYIAKLWSDPWGGEYQYRERDDLNGDGYEVWTLGSDGAAGGEGAAADCGHWQQCEEVYREVNELSDHRAAASLYLGFAAIVLLPGMPLYLIGMFLRRRERLPLFVGYHLYAYGHVSLLAFGLLALALVARAL